MTREEAIKAIKAWDFLNNDEKEVIETLIPELAESEDERIRKWLINLVKSHIEWLEDRIREQLSNGQVYGGELNEAKNAIAWLEKQGEQKPAEWSDEDEEHLSDAIFFVREYQIPTRDKRLLNAAKEAEDWLKSLRPQNTWKPSDEQMDMLAKVCSTLHLTTGENEIMESIYDALKKLK